MEGKRRARNAWDREIARLGPDLRQDNALAGELAELAGRVFKEYENALAEAEARAGEMEARYDRLVLQIQSRSGIEEEPAYGYWEAGDYG